MVKKMYPIQGGDGDNMAKLRDLVDRLEDDELKGKFVEDRYEWLSHEIKRIIDINLLVIKKEKNKDNKLKCYETMCSKIKIILENIKIS